VDAALASIVPAATVATAESVRLLYLELGAHGARAFVARVCFRKFAAESGSAFEDVRVPFSSWAALKSSGVAPLNQLPILFIGERTITQSVPISAFAARQAGLFPTDPLAALASEEVVAIVDELWNRISSTSKERPDSRVSYANDVAPRYLSLLSKRLGDDTFFGGADTPAWVDLWVFQYVSFFSSGFFDSVPTDFVARHAPLLVAHADRVKASELYLKYGSPE
jgi:hypothetical protein